MQLLARDGLSTDEVREIITSATPSVSWGVDVLNLDGTVDQALTDATDFLACKVSRANDATGAAGTVDVTVGQELPWGTVRVRPWQSVGGARFDLGVYGLQLPDVRPASHLYQAQGADLTAELFGVIPGNRWDGRGADALDAVRRAVSDCGVLGLVTSLPRIPALPLASDFVSVLTANGQVSWQQYINGLFRAISWRDVFADGDGRLCSAPIVPLADRSSEWSFDMTDAATNIVDPDRTLTIDGVNQTNWWRFVRNGFQGRPTDGDGQVTVDRTDGGPKRGVVFFYDAVSQSNLQLLADRRVALDLSRTTRLSFTTGPLPCLGVDDVVDVTDTDLGWTKKLCRVVDWDQQVDAARCSITVEVL